MVAVAVGVFVAAEVAVAAGVGVLVGGGVAVGATVLVCVALGGREVAEGASAALVGASVAAG